MDDKVRYLYPRLVPGKPSKITDQWLGPYKIIERTAEVSYKIKPAWVTIGKDETVDFFSNEMFCFAY